MTLKGICNLCRYEGAVVIVPKGTIAQSSPRVCKECLLKLIFELENYNLEG